MFQKCLPGSWHEAVFGFTGMMAHVFQNIWNFFWPSLGLIIMAIIDYNISRIDMVSFLLNFFLLFTLYVEKPRMLSKHLDQKF